jgi:hypothetical protein
MIIEEIGRENAWGGGGGVKDLLISQVPKDFLLELRPKLLCTQVRKKKASMAVTNRPIGGLDQAGQGLFPSTGDAAMVRK